MYYKFSVESNVKANHNCYRLTIKAPDDFPSSSIAVPFYLRISKPGNAQCRRPYTPMSYSSADSKFNLLVKRYENGTLSPYVCGLSEGDMVSVSAPIQKPNLDNLVQSSDTLGLIAGGTGITPILQLLNYILSAKDAFGIKNKKVALLYANRKEEDMVLKKDIEDLQSQFPDFSVYYFLDTPPDGNSTYIKGYVEKQAIDDIFSGLNMKRVCFLVCGPREMVAHITDGPGSVLRSAGYADSQIFVF